MAKKITMWQDAAGNLHHTEEEAVCADARISARAKLERFFENQDGVYSDSVDGVVDALLNNLGFFRTVLDAAAEPVVKKNQR